ncbi:hypothetical protein N7540_003308 [Penicillium herquei]|nr:hypothetical protein N7540_003308 [Penicillium herquei]
MDIEIIPANNYTAYENINMTIALPGPITTICPQTITVSQNTTMTCQELAIAYNIPTAGIWNLNNDVYCNWVTDQDICAPLSCPITVVSTDASFVNVDDYIYHYANFTMTQFLTWNPYIGSRQIANGDAICVGPPGGLYSPPSAAASVNSSTTYTTTAIPASPTPSGTAINCGAYYLVNNNDECGVICEGNSLTLASFIAMNPSINANCTNLVVGMDYCIATVNGSAPTTPTTSTTTTSFISAPTATVSGTTSECYKWHTVVSGDTCQIIESEYGITLDVFRALNTYIDSNCDNLWVNYTYCVSGVSARNGNSTSKIPSTLTSTSPAISATTTSATSTSSAASVTTPTPTQTGMVSGCKTFYEAVSGDGCYDIAESFGITLDEFYEWNAAVGNTCGGLWPDYYYCVGI